MHVDPRALFPRSGDFSLYCVHVQKSRCVQARKLFGTIVPDSAVRGDLTIVLIDRRR